MLVLAAQINPIIGDIKGNCQKIIEAINFAKTKKVGIVLFPELSLSGYPPQDLLLMPHFIDELDFHLQKIIEATNDITAIVGTIRKNTNNNEKPLFATAAVISNKELLGFQDKSLLATYDVFDEARYFEPAKEVKTWNLLGKTVAITICEDIWHLDKNPCHFLKKEKIDLIFNLSASPFELDKWNLRLKICENFVKACKAPLIYCNQVGGNDSLIFDGFSFYMNAEGKILQLAKGFKEDLMLIDTLSTPLPLELKKEPYELLYEALILGIKDYFRKLGFKKACLGLSGGIDSALVASLAVAALGKENVLGIAMPSRYSSTGSIEDAKILAKNLGIKLEILPIENTFKSYLETLDPLFHDLKEDVTEENLQARIRGMLLMAISNKQGYVVLSTGNKSEMAMGYCTLYGDMCGGLSVISDLTKKQVYNLSRWINKDKEIIPENTFIKAPSAELRENQKDQDTLPDYDIVDQVCESYIIDHLYAEVISKKFNYDLELVKSLIKRIHQNEYKRRQAPPGLKVSAKAFSIGRKFPIVEKFV